MPLSKLVFKPGINKDQTNYASEGGWYDCDKIRFRSGFPEKIGGWQVQTFTQYVGTARSLFSWATSGGQELVCVGTSKKIYMSTGTDLYDITPIRKTFTHSTTPTTDNCFQTTNLSTTVKINIVGHGAIDGDYVTFSGAVAVGGVTAPMLNKEFAVTFISANQLSIVVSGAATSTVAAGGGVVIVAAFQINIGNDVVTAGFGWGTGSWGRGTWGSASTVAVLLPARLEFQDKFYNDLIFNINDSDIYYWTYDSSFATRAVLLSTHADASDVPELVQKIMFAPSGHLLAFNCTEFGSSLKKPLTIRWANVDADAGPLPWVWTPTLTNTAGFLELQSGNYIVTAVRTRQEILVWTDTSMASLQFLGTQEVFGIQEISTSTTILGPNVVATANGISYWMGNEKFYSYNGTVATLPCTLRQYIFDDINRTQGQIVFAGTNNQFNEIIWFYCSGTANEIDRYVIFNYAESIWYFGQLERTAWLDAGVIFYPIAADKGWVYTHENGHDEGQPLGAESLPLDSYIQSADIDIDDGEKFMLIRRLIPDVNFGSSDAVNSVTQAPLTPEAVLTVGVRNFPGATSSTVNASGIPTDRTVVTTATINQYTNQVFVRARGRQMNFRIESSGIGVQWQLGMPRVDARADGTRS